MSKKESENDRYNRMKKIEREMIIEKYKNLEEHEDYDIRKRRKFIKNSIENIAKYKKTRNIDTYDDYDYI